MVEARTVDYREDKAKALEAEGRRRVKRALHAGHPPSQAALAGRWHKGRANGQRYRFQNAVDCGHGWKELEVTCQACGNVEGVPLTCGASLVCISCRGRLQAKRRWQVGNGQRIVMHRAHRAGLDRSNRKGGRWTDKFITLTIPHLREHEIGDRIDLAHRAWTRWLKAFNAWLRKAAPRGPSCSHKSPCGGCENCLVTWYGSHEWTVGKDERGHPHVQLWFFGPFIDCDVEEMWRRALVKVGLDASMSSWEGDVIVRVQKARDVKGGVYELIKYVVKDIVADGEFVRPELYAELFENLDGRRLRRGSKGFIQLCEEPAPCDCGESGCWSTRVVPKTDPVELEEREAIEERSCGP